VSEQDERKPVEFYGRSKLEAELAVEAASDAFAWTIIRPPIVYGPGDVDNLQLYRLAQQRLNLFYGNRERAMSWVYVDDLIRGIRTAAESDAARSRGYFVCDGSPRTWGEYQQQIVDASGKRVLHLDLPELFADAACVLGELATRIDKKPRLFNRQKAVLSKLSWTCRHDSARADFGYAPQVHLKEGIGRTFRWYRERGWL
jgi:nucleoside-diphosphate-sugar epimerase